MKTFSFSMLVLISSAACLSAQGPDGDKSNRFKPHAASESRYYAKPEAITARANHVLSKASSKRSEYAEIPVGNLVPPKVVPGFATPVPVTDSRATASKRNRKHEAALVSMNQPIKPKRYQSGTRSRSRQGYEIQAPPTAQEVFSQVGRPSPRNSSVFDDSGFDTNATDIEIGPVAEFEASPEADPLRYRENPRSFGDRSEGVEIGPATDYEYGEAPSFESSNAVTPRGNAFGETFSTQWTPAEGQGTPLNAVDVFERVETRAPEASQMRHVSDHFSPGGKPFAEKTPQQRNIFGADPGASCDEWANFSGCGGLKANPGHLGLPWLKSKDSCDQTTRRIHFNCKRRTQGSCDCQPSRF